MGSIRILLCAGSNPALDEVVYRLMLHGLVDRHGKRQRLSPGAIVRVGPKNKVRKDCLDVYLDHVRLRQTDAPTKALATEWTIKTASIVCSTLSGCRHPQLDELKFNFNVVIVGTYLPALLTCLRRVFPVPHARTRLWLGLRWCMSPCVQMVGSD